MEHETIECPACGSQELVWLPIPHTDHSMASDGRVVLAKLQKCSCLTCGHGFHAFPPTAALLRGLYDSEYDLGLRDRTADLKRAENYAEHIISLLPSGSGSTLIEFGCGSGNMLRLLASRLGSERAIGIEPSARLVDAAQFGLPENVAVRNAFAEDYADNSDELFDLCVAVNVAEHALVPESFLNACRKVMTPSGVVVIVCPDGETASSELLFYDHISSFTRQSLSVFAERANLALVSSHRLDGALTGFCAHVLHVGRSKRACHESYQQIADERAAYLSIWQNGETTVKEAASGKDYAVFGVGEFTNLLAAYCPSVIENAAYFVVDDASANTIFGKEIVATERYLADANVHLLAAVNERNWTVVLKRFSHLGVSIAHPFDLSTWRSDQ